MGAVRSVLPYDSRGPQGTVHLVEVEYFDDYRHPQADQILWEIETNAQVFGTTSLPLVDEKRPDNPSVLRAFINAHRWSRLNRLRATDGIEDEPILGVWNSAIQVHPYQLEPVLKALEMPRVSLLLADGVGLGKTIQAGLVLEELLLRRRIRRILILSPAMLQRQWRYELKRKFNLDFEIIDSDSTFQLRRRLGIDTNPWKAYPRVITSMDYLRLPDILQQFLQASGATDDGNPLGQAGPHAPWDLLIVDECHNFAPQNGSRASQRTRMLRDIRFLFEHRVFLSATPHNGKTVCFTGLLELLDPVRFQLKTQMDERDHLRLGEVRIRRLKDDINRHSLRPPFAEQLPPEELPVRLTPQEIALYSVLREYRREGTALLQVSGSASERWVASFIFSILTKRLLSCPFAFARTWWRHIEEEPEQETDLLFDLARTSSHRAEDEVRSDSERATAEEDAARFGGAWLRRKEDRLQELVQRVNRALETLGYDRRTVQDDRAITRLAAHSDSKTDTLVAWVKQNLFTKGGRLRDDERLIVFTEYKETLQYLEQRLLQEGFDKNTLNLLYGGMGASDFEEVQQAFEDPAAPVRLLIATDAASEGINMQECCRWVVHFDIAWSPTKLQQRNGRVSRHGQVRDVSVFYFRSNQDEDMEFLFKVAAKVDQVKEDLGSVEHVLANSIQRHFEGFTIAEADIDQQIEEERSRSAEKLELGKSSGAQIVDLTKRARELLEATELRLGISAETLIEIMRSAIRIEGQGMLEEITGKPGFFRLSPPPRWESLVRSTLTVGPRSDRMELVFDQALVEEEVNGRRVMRLKKHQVLMRLSHPVMRQALATLSKELHAPSGHDPVYRWTVGCVHHGGFEALLAFHYVVTAINELREPLHDEVRAAVFRVEGDALERVEPDFETSILRDEVLPILSEERRDSWWRTLRARWRPHKGLLESFMGNTEKALRASLEKAAKLALQREKAALAEIYTSRLKELADTSRERELRKLAESLSRAEAESAQLWLLQEDQFRAERELHDVEEQITILSRDIAHTRTQLEREQDNRLNALLPRRYTLREVRVLPLAIQYIVPATAEDLK